MTFAVTVVSNFFPPICSYQWLLRVSRLMTSASFPLVTSEFGAGAVDGLHRLPSVMFTEDYQSATLESYWAALDRLRADFLVGEMIWNFADFGTAQSPTRVAGNRKGLFTRQRQPKSAAFAVRERWNKMVDFP